MARIDLDSQLVGLSVNCGRSIESEADRLILDLYRDLFDNERDPAHLLLRKDLFELLEKAIDRCRDAGNVIYQIVLKNS